MDSDNCLCTAAGVEAEHGNAADMVAECGCQDAIGHNSDAAECSAAGQGLAAVAVGAGDIAACQGDAAVEGRIAAVDREGVADRHDYVALAASAVQFATSS